MGAAKEIEPKRRKVTNGDTSKMEDPRLFYAQYSAWLDSKSLYVNKLRRLCHI